MAKCCPQPSLPRLFYRKSCRPLTSWSDVITLTTFEIVILGQSSVIQKILFGYPIVKNYRPRPQFFVVPEHPVLGRPVPIYMVVTLGWQAAL